MWESQPDKPVHRVARSGSRPASDSAPRPMNDPLAPPVDASWPPARMTAPSLSPARALALQRTIGNTAVNALLRQIAAPDATSAAPDATSAARPVAPSADGGAPPPPRDDVAGGARQPVIQRAILPVFQPGHEQEILAQALKQQTLLGHGAIVHTGGLFARMAAAYHTKGQYVADLAGIGPHEDLHIIGHGSPLTIGGRPAHELARYLVDELKLPVGYRGMIYLEACHSGEVDVVNDQARDYLREFRDALNAVRKERNTDAASAGLTGYHGTVVLDHLFEDIFKEKRVTMRVLSPGTTMEELRARVPEAHQIAIGEERTLIDELRQIVGKDFETWIMIDKSHTEEVTDYAHAVYSLLLASWDDGRKSAQSVGGSLTRTSRPGMEERTGPDYQAMLAANATMRNAIVARARAWKKDLPNIEVLDPATLGLAPAAASSSGST